MKGKSYPKEIKRYALKLIDRNKLISDNEVIKHLKKKYSKYKPLQTLNKRTVNRWRKKPKYIKNSKNAYNSRIYTKIDKEYLLSLPNNLDMDAFTKKVNNHNISNDRPIDGLFKQYKKLKRTSSTTAVGQLNFGAELNLYNITRKESVSDSFNDARDKDLYHFTWVPHNKLIRFTEALKNRYIELLGEVITKDQRVYLDSCIDALVLISDYMVRECASNGDYDYNEPGCESPHVRNPTSGKFRDHCPQFVYACSKFIPGAWKHMLVLLVIGSRQNTMGKFFS